MKITFFLFISLIPIYSFSQSENLILSSSIGYTHTSKFYHGVCNEFSFGYLPLKYAGVQFSINNVYLYSNEGGAGFSESYTNTGTAIGAILTTGSLMGNQFFIGSGLSYNLLYYTWAFEKYNGASGRNFSISPYLEAAYAYNFKRISLGLKYKQMEIKKYDSAFRNKQILLTISKDF